MSDRKTESNSPVSLPARADGPIPICSPPVALVRTPLLLSNSLRRVWFPSGKRPSFLPRFVHSVPKLKLFILLIDFSSAMHPARRNPRTFSASTSSGRRERADRRMNVNHLVHPSSPSPQVSAAQTSHIVHETTSRQHADFFHPERRSPTSISSSCEAQRSERTPSLRDIPDPGQRPRKEQSASSILNARRDFSVAITRPSPRRGYLQCRLCDREVWGPNGKLLVIDKQNRNPFFPCSCACHFAFHQSSFFLLTSSMFNLHLLQAGIILTSVLFYWTPARRLVTTVRACLPSVALTYIQMCSSLCVDRGRNLRRSLGLSCHIRCRWKTHARHLQRTNLMPGWSVDGRATSVAFDVTVRYLLQTPDTTRCIAKLIRRSSLDLLSLSGSAEQTKRNVSKKSDCAFAPRSKSK